MAKGTQPRRPRVAVAAVGAAPTPYDLALGAFRAGDFPACTSLLRVFQPHGSAELGRVALLRAELARVTGDIESLYEAAGIAAEKHPEAQSRLVAQLLRARAARARGDEGEARLLQGAVERDLAKHEPAGIGRVIYLLALEAWFAGRNDEAEALTRRNLAAGAAVAESLSLLGWIETRRQRYVAAVEHFVASLDRLGESSDVFSNAHFRGRLINAIAVVASETIDLSLGRRVRTEYDRLTWAGGLRREQFQTLICLQNLALLEGNADDAYLFGRRAIEVAPSIPLQIVAETELAAVGLSYGDTYGPGVMLRRAWELLRAYPWTTADDGERVALTTFALEAAALMPAEARKAVTLYQSLRAKANPMSVLSNDPRLQAFELMAAARVCEALGRDDQAIEYYRRALEFWRGIGHGLRAVSVALDLRRLTGREEYAAIGEAVLARAPDAWFGRRLRESSPISMLSLAQLCVLAGLLEGESTAVIAAVLGRSAHAVANHTRKICAAFGVRSREALAARCLELGVTPERLRQRA